MDAHRRCRGGTVLSYRHRGDHNYLGYSGATRTLDPHDPGPPLVMGRGITSRAAADLRRPGADGRRAGALRRIPGGGADRTGRRGAAAADDRAPGTVRPADAGAAG